MINVKDKSETIIYYFSGTGNSLALAKILASHLENCELRSMANQIKHQEFAINSKCIGFIFPNNFGKVPKIVIKFLDNCSLQTDAYIFAIVSGGGGSGYAFNGFKKILKHKKMSLNAACEVILPSNYIIASYYNIANRDQATKELLFKEAEKKMALFADVIKENKSFYEIKNNIARVVSKLFNIPNNLSNVKLWDRFYHYDQKCNSCCICEKICPVNNIKIETGKPQWLHNCQLCLACIHFCPKEAIQFKNKTQNQKRYHHPAVTLEEIISINSKSVRA